ncbi:Chromosome partition protein Smc [Usitatibacter rugosus]|uniref:Chromosome partition protein Smc n=1 Tax=Usitatibacter rugosus TaxID=2732067 RepID=A0A6M4GU01_9PROT|nr:chromosome segregation protein SMC [Usitatibacter rugosus]QJR09964.1 Chromosome partition protein Smc [Usitatibacter rugosus]
MRLTSVKLAGFKSFVDPTTIAVPGQLVGVVGPNGCGKSNVIDAVRWVLGETSAKQLRGEHMHDVIFNGSAERKPVGRASVELVFDNSLGRVGGAWAQYTEISVKRVLSRDGDSNYYINGQHVRRRDVQDIFLGTGLGPRAYSIIEQGMISRVITSKPEELRVFLEEAAGVSKYRERRRETELRLEDTRENLSRVGDIQAELETQVGHLAQQAEVAGKYNELQTQLALNHNLLTFTRLREADTAKTRYGNEVQKVTVALEAETAKLRENERALEDLRHKHYQETDHLSQLQGNLYAANADVQSLEQEIAFLGENRRRMTVQLDGLATEIGEVERRISEAHGERDRFQSDSERARAAIGERAADVERARAALPAAEEAARTATANVKSAGTEMSAAEQAQGIEESRESHALKILSQLEARKNRLKQENMALVFPEPEKLAGLERERDSLREKVSGLETQQKDAEGRLPALEDERRAAVTTLQEKTREVANLEAALKALESQQAKLDNNSKLADWARQHALDRSERLWQAMHVEAGWDDAVEAALGVRLNAARLSDESNLSSLLRDAPPGNFAVFIERGVPDIASASSHLRPLSSVVTSTRPGVLAYVKEALGNVFILPDGEEGLALAKVLPPGGLLVSKAGHLFGRQGVVFHGPQSELHGVLQRQREIEDLQGRIPAQVRSRAEVDERLKALEIELREGQDNARRVREELQRARQQDHDLEVEYLKLSQSSKQAEARREAIRVELSEIEKQEEGEKLEMSEAQHALQRGSEAIETIVQRLQALEESARDAQSALDTARAGILAAERAHQEAQYTERSATDKAASQGQLAVSLGERLSALGMNKAKVSEELGALEEGNVRERLQGALQVKSERERILADARSGLEHLADELRSLEEGRLSVEQNLNPMRERITELKLKEQEAVTNAEQYATQLQEAGVTREEMAEQIEKRVGSRTMQAEITRLTEEIAALGPVNLAALQELETARDRKGFLDAQATDLFQAVETLEAAIKRIDRETREMLQSTFDIVSANFTEMFPALFGGGQASLKLTGEEILDAGVQVFAQPPGKKNASIQLLSGGEKALTAIALVFSLFKLNPAPFCLLDEVDAPLDDPNTVRFCELVKQMSAQTQFLFITHNKITMELGEQLVGVTMQEPGVSRIVEVDIEAAMEFARKQAA